MLKKIYACRILVACIPRLHSACTAPSMNTIMSFRPGGDRTKLVETRILFVELGKYHSRAEHLIDIAYFFIESGRSTIVLLSFRKLVKQRRVHVYFPLYSETSILIIYTTTPRQISGDRQIVASLSKATALRV